MDRLIKKWHTASSYVPAPQQYQTTNAWPVGLLFYGTSQYAAEEALDLLRADGIELDAMRIKAFPFNSDVANFITAHDRVFVIDQNRDAQMRSLLMIELNASPEKLVSVLNYDGMPITADNIVKQIRAGLA